MPEVSNPKPEISNSESEYSNPQSEIRNPKSNQLGINKLDKKSRAKALAALAGLVILGVAMIALTWLGARVTLRYMNPTPFDHQRIKSSAPPENDWAKKPLVDNAELERPNGA